MARFEVGTHVFTVTTATQLTTDNDRVLEAEFRAHPMNNGVVVVGTDSSITTSNDTNLGYRLEPWEPPWRRDFRPASVSRSTFWFRASDTGDSITWAFTSRE
jgi:hypothetical protein